MRIEDVDLLALQSRLMRADPTTQGLCKGLNREYRKLAPEIRKCLGVALLYIDPDAVSDEVLAILAYDLKVDWYDDGASREARVATVKNAKKVQRIMGTPAAVELAVAPYFDQAFVREWWEYDGDPYHYKIFVQGELTADESSLLTRTIARTARATAVLDAVASITLSSGSAYTGGAVIVRHKTVIREA